MCSPNDLEPRGFGAGEPERKLTHVHAQEALAEDHEEASSDQDGDANDEHDERAGEGSAVVARQTPLVHGVEEARFAQVAFGRESERVSDEGGYRVN